MRNKYTIDPLDKDFSIYKIKLRKKKIKASKAGKVLTKVKTK